MSDEKITYLNYAATSFPKSKVALESFYKSISSIPSGTRHHGPNKLNELKKRVENILQIDRAFLFFTDSATTGLNQVIRGFSKGAYSVAIDNRSHNAVVRPWRTVAEPLLASIYDNKDHFLEEELIQMLTKMPDLFVLTYVSNVNGSIYPIEQAIKLIRSFSPSTAILVDASQAAGAISLQALSLADFAVFPAHKHLHSLPGAALLIAKRQIHPLILGGTETDTLDERVLGEQEFFKEMGTPNFPAITALVDALEYATSTLEQHQKLETSLVEKFLEGVGHCDEIEVVTGRENRVGIVALKPKFGSSELHWAPYLRSQQIIVRGGLHCSPLHHQQLGLSQTGTLRVSFGWDSNESDVVKALKGIREFCSVSKEVF